MRTGAEETAQAENASWTPLTSDVHTRIGRSGQVMNETCKTRVKKDEREGESSERCRGERETQRARFGEGDPGWGARRRGGGAPAVGERWS